MSKNTGTVRHTHQYYRHDDGLWHCSGRGKGCTHYLPKNMPPPVGRMSICWGCPQEFQLAPYNMKNDYPVCDECTEQQALINALTEKKLAEVIKGKPQKNYGSLSHLAKMTGLIEDEPTTEDVVESIEEDKPTSEDV